VRASSREALVRAFRDLALMDREDHSCGIVDEIEAAEVQPGIWELQALLVGPRAWRLRRPRGLTRLLQGRKLVRIDAADVASATTVVRLLKRADELDLAPVERKLLRWCGGN
jgi:hypothetical protein